jgi:hypothetical protein
MKEFLLRIGSKILERGQELGIALIAVFAPVHPVMLVAATLVVVDLITGLIASKKQNIPITSAGLKRSVGKILLYEVSICVAFLVQQYLTGDIFPASKLVAALIGLTELKSLSENLNIISGRNVLTAFIDRIVQAQKDVSDKNEK